MLAEWFGTALDSRMMAAAKLLVSELVTNAVVHGRGMVTLRAGLDERRLLVEVVDEGGGFERVLRERDFASVEVGGWGLSVVDSEASRWGVHEGTTDVWFELERPGPRISPERDSSA